MGSSCAMCRPATSHRSTSALTSRNSPTPTLRWERRLNTGTATPPPFHCSGWLSMKSWRATTAGVGSAAGLSPVQMHAMRHSPCSSFRGAPGSPLARTAYLYVIGIASTGVAISSCQVSASVRVSSTARCGCQLPSSAQLPVSTGVCPFSTRCEHTVNCTTTSPGSGSTRTTSPSGSSVRRLPEKMASVKAEDANIFSWCPPSCQSSHSATSASWCSAGCNMTERTPISIATTPGSSLITTYL
mmetsp:Transcript_25097/g.63206  ORF Transcript_25097/g.63206 Transcript_25097/m.63206 type:complete len:243 (+) Transcript_25097:136-864(+)